jgi:hypothetical protein
VAYDEDLADRIRAALPGPGFAAEQRMFGGLAWNGLRRAVRLSRRRA